MKERDGMVFRIALGFNKRFGTGSSVPVRFDLKEFVEIVRVTSSKRSIDSPLDKRSRRYDHRRLRALRTSSESYFRATGARVARFQDRDKVLSSSVMGEARRFAAENLPTPPKPQ